MMFCSGRESEQETEGSLAMGEVASEPSGFLWEEFDECGRSGFSHRSVLSTIAQLNSGAIAVCRPDTGANGKDKAVATHSIFPGSLPSSWNNRTSSAGVNRIGSVAVSSSRNLFHRSSAG